MAHAQSRVTALFDIDWRSAESTDEKIPQPLFRSGQIIRRVDRPQDLVSGNPPVERRHQTLESWMPDRGVKLVLFHSVDRINPAAFTGSTWRALRGSALKV